MVEVTGRWSDWIQHDGSGRPDFQDGMLLEVVLLDPERNFDLFATIRVIAGQYGPVDDVVNVHFSDSGIDPSWRLPADPEWLYVTRYRVWEQGRLEDIFELEDLREET